MEIQRKCICTCIFNRTIYEIKFQITRKKEKKKIIFETFLNSIISEIYNIQFNVWNIVGDH